MTQTLSPANRPRRAVRDTEAAVIGGVAAGLADHLRLPVLWVRAAFVVATLAGGFGVVLYAACWLFLPASVPSSFAGTPGGQAGERRGVRPVARRRLADVGPAVALLALGAGVVLLVESTLGFGVVAVPLTAGAVGLALLWRQADEAQRERWLDATGRLDPVRVVFGQGGWAAYVRVAAGAILVLGALGLVALHGTSLSDARNVAIAFGVALAGVGVVVGPWVSRLVGELSAERAERIRTQERADVAAHIHDSVLQTLALIQRSADDPAAVARLARGQERDLRRWLYDATPAGTVASALREAAAEVEDAFGVAIEVVVVGDAPLGERQRAVVGAAREALTNAAKHAGTGRASLYAEIDGASVEVFVRDRGAGFDPATVPQGRHGVRDSIVGRVERHGGTATILSTPGEGTEVQVRLEVTEAAGAAGARGWTA